MSLGLQFLASQKESFHQIDQWFPSFLTGITALGLSFILCYPLEGVADYIERLKCKLEKNIQLLFCLSFFTFPWFQPNSL